MYSPSKFTYGNKTTAQINAITSRSVADTAYNINYYKRDFYNGFTNLNQDMMTLTANTNITLGYGVRMLSDNVVQLSTAASTTLGVATKAATTGSVVSIAIGGIYPVYFNGTVTRARIALPDNAPQGQWNSAVPPAPNYTAGTLIQSGTTGAVYNTLIAPCEKA